MVWACMSRMFGVVLLTFPLAYDYALRYYQRTKSPIPNEIPK